MGKKSPSDLDLLIESVVAFRDARDWKQFHNAKELAISLSVEANELLEHFKWLRPEEVAPYMCKHKKEIGEEIVDVVYHILLVCHDYDIDLKEAFEKKMIKNAEKYPIAKARGKHKKYTEL